MDQVLTQRGLERLFWQVTYTCLGLQPPPPAGGAPFPEGGKAGDPSGKGVGDEGADDNGYHVQDPAQLRVRISWPTYPEDSTMPEWGREEPVCFLQITQASDPYTEQFNQTYIGGGDTLTGRVTYTKRHQVNYVFYGPGACDDADTVRAAMFRDEVRAILAASNLYPINGMAQIHRIPELIDGGWWERCDLFLAFYEGAYREYGADYIDRAPDVEMVRD